MVVGGIRAVSPAYAILPPAMRSSRAAMRRPNDNLPAPPELPSFTVEPTPTEPGGANDAVAAERHAGTGLIRYDVGTLLEDRIDPDAAKVVRRLERAGHQAYLVGGCVRDLLLDGTPKDFDVATSARPEDVRAIFRNCRIIGRRFRLAHVLFGAKVIEVATFRRNPVTEVPEDEVATEAETDILIRSDNVFGDAHEDAIRRDFTINALFYDVDRRQILDWCGGMEDIKRRRIHTIGDPIIRFREDPVRILRAVKFAARLDLGIEPDVYDAMVSCRELLARSARPRIFEEILRLLRGGAAHRSMWLLWETGAMAILLPELSAFVDDDEATAGGGARFWAKMSAIDAKTKAHGRPLDDIVLWTSLLQEPIEEACSGARDRIDAMLEFLEPIVERIAMPRRIADGLRRIVAVQPRLAAGKVGRLARNEMLGPALEVLELDWVARGKDLAPLEKMRADLPPPLPAAARSVARGGAWRRRSGAVRRG
jgi:poly(A) polymerase